MCTIVKTMKCCAVRNIKMGSVHMLKLVMFSSVTRILQGGGVSVSDTFWIRIRLGYASDTFPDVSWKCRYVLCWIRVSDTFGPDWIRPKALVSPISLPRPGFRLQLPLRDRIAAAAVLDSSCSRSSLTPDLLSPSRSGGRRRAPSLAKIGRRRGPPFKTSKFFPELPPLSMFCCELKPPLLLSFAVNSLKMCHCQYQHNCWFQHDIYI